MSALASSAACEHQAFQLGSAVIGLQCHLETTPEAARALVTNCRADLAAGPYVQSADAILAADQARYATINTVMADILTYLHGRAARSSR